MEQTNPIRTNHHAERLAEKFQLEQRLKSKGNLSACRDSQRCLQQSIDQFRRANRDLGELAAFVAASLTTITAIEAVINIAVEKIGLAKEILQAAFHSYIGFLILILILGILRFGIVVWRRAQAEKEMDQAKRRIFEFCLPEHWPKLEE